MSTKFWFPVIVLAALIAGLCCAALAGTPPELFDFRLMRLLTALSVGGALALAGCLTQMLFRNALATPDTLGVSGGAAVGAALAILFGAGDLFWYLSCGAFAGAWGIFLLVLVVGRFGRSTATELLLAGVIAGTLVSGALLYLISQSGATELAGISWWMLGDLSGAGTSGIAALASASLLTLIWMRLFANDLNAMAFGDEGAALLGVAVTRVRLAALGLTTLLVALAVSSCGIIGFVGLIVPHIMRKISGNDARILPLHAFLGGALFLAACDRLGRWIDPVRQLPPGVVTSIIGGGLFLLVLYRKGGCRE